jgi:hypothetical protein
MNGVTVESDGQVSTCERAFVDFMIDTRLLVFRGQVNIYNVAVVFPPKEIRVSQAQLVEFPSR